MKVDGHVLVPPVEAEDFSIMSGGLFSVLYFPSMELEVRFVPVDFHYFRVVVPGKFRGHTEGLCGECFHSSHSHVVGISYEVTDQLLINT